jgi:hypothetical protein
MIRNDREYQEALRRLKNDQGFIVEQRRALEAVDLRPDEVERAMGPALVPCAACRGGRVVRACSPARL